MRFIAGHSAVLFVVIAMAAGLFTVGCFGPLISIYVRACLHASAGVFGIISAMVGAGWIAGMPLLRAAARRLPNATIVLVGLAGLGLAALMLATLPYIVVSILATFTLGVAVSAVIVPAQTLLQQETPPPLVGRVSSTSMSVVFLGQVLGLVASGVLASAFDVRVVFFMCAVLAVTLAIAGRLFMHTAAPAHAAAQG